MLQNESALARSMVRETWGVRLWAFLKIRLLFFVRPTVLELDEERCVVRVALNWRTRNHLGSMYFGTLCVGADTAGGLIAFREIEKRGNRVSLIFKDFHAEFLKRPEDDVHFTCTDGAAIRALVHAALETGERQSLPVNIVATVPTKFGDEPVARFVLTMSLKRR